MFLVACFIVIENSKGGDNMTIYGYVRVSSKEQNPDRQLYALVEKGIHKSNIYIDYESGKDFNRPSYKKLLGALQPEDCVVIKSIDRLGRNYSDILEQWRIITKEKQADVEVIDMPLLNTDSEKDGLTGKLISDLVLQILAYVAETEREFIKQRQKEGINAAKSRGAKFGRPKKDVTDRFGVAHQKWISGELSSREAADYADMSHSTFYRRCKEQKNSDNNCFIK